MRAPHPWAAVALCAAITLGLSACGGSDDDDDRSPSTEASALDETATTPWGRDMTPPVAGEGLDADLLPPDSADTLPATLRPPA